MKSASKINEEKILVTGAAGLVGTHALLRLKDMSNVSVRAVDFQKEPRVAAKNIKPVLADLTRLDECRKVVEGIDSVLMFAAKIDRRSANLEHIITTLNINFNVLEAAFRAGVKKVVWLSSATAYPPHKDPARENEMFVADPYDSFFSVGWMSRYIEVLCRMYATKLGRPMSSVVLRSTAIYGEYGDFDFSTCHVLPALIRKVVERQKPLVIWGKGLAMRDYIHAGDVADASLLALEKIEGFNEFNIGAGKSYSVRELLDLIVEIDGYSDASIDFDESKADKSNAISVDCTKAKKILGFVPKISLETGIRRTMKWYRENCLKGN